MYSTSPYAVELLHTNETVSVSEVFWAKLRAKTVLSRLGVLISGVSSESGSTVYT